MKKLFTMCLICTTIIGYKLVDSTIVTARTQEKEQSTIVQTVKKTVETVTENFECIDEKDMAQTYEDIEVVDEYEVSLAYNNMC